MMVCGAAKKVVEDVVKAIEQGVPARVHARSIDADRRSLRFRRRSPVILLAMA